MKHITAFVVATSALFAPAIADAQSADSRWQPWLGCWVSEGRVPATTASTVCVLPSPDGRSVTVRSFEGNRELLSEAIVPDGTPQRLAEKACSGERTTRWAARGPRFYTNATLACEGQPESKTSSVSELVRPDVWLEVQVSGAKGGEQVRTRRLLRSGGTPPARVAEQVRALRPTRVAPEPVQPDDVIDASRNVSVTTVEAWLAESGSRASLDRRGLLQLADAKVQPRVIDLMVAMAYPQKFQVRRNSSSSSGGGGAGGWFGGGGWGDDGFYPGSWSYLLDVYGLGYGSFGLPYLYSGLGSGYYFYPGNATYFIPSGGGGGASAQEEHGQVVNGQGYTRIQPRPGYQGTASAGGNASSGSSSGSSDGGNYSSQGSSGSSAGSSGASPGGYSGGGSSSSGGTAVPR